MNKLLYPMNHHWHSIDEELFLPEESDDERVVVTWIDAENPSDIGIETTVYGCLDLYCEDDRHRDIYWRFLNDSPTFQKQSDLLDEMEDDWL